MMGRGYSRDHRPDCEQMVIALIVNREMAWRPNRRPPKGAGVVPLNLRPVGERFKRGALDFAYLREVGPARQPADLAGV
jgi:hypothetical protein